MGRAPKQHFKRCMAFIIVGSSNRSCLVNKKGYAGRRDVLTRSDGVYLPEKKGKGQAWLSCSSSNLRKASYRVSSSSVGHAPRRTNTDSLKARRLPLGYLPQAGVHDVDRILSLSNFGICTTTQHTTTPAKAARSTFLGPFSPGPA